MTTINLPIKLPENARYVAQDADGAWYAYTSKPELSPTHPQWAGPTRGGKSTLITNQWVQYDVEDWKDSLQVVERRSTDTERRATEREDAPRKEFPCAYLIMHGLCPEHIVLGTENEAQNKMKELSRRQPSDWTVQRLEFSKYD